MQVRKYIEQGWPEAVKEPQLKSWWHKRNSLSIYNNVILLQTDSTRIVIPEKLQNEVLKLLHEGHWGVTRMKQQARRYCYWVSLDADIVKFVEKCESCGAFKSVTKKEYTSWPTPTEPWERVHIDFAGPFMGKMWLICVDAGSKFPYVIDMHKTTTQWTIRALEKVFTIEGLPRTIVSDNGPQFMSAEFKRFCTDNDIEHLTSAVYHPESNGEAERFVRTFKTALNKNCFDGTTVGVALTKFLATYRATPIPGINKSPAEMLHGRQPRSLLTSLMPVKHKHSTQPCDTKFKKFDKVYARNFSPQHHKWSKAVILETLGHRLYLVKTNYGVWKRHQNQIRKRNIESPNFIINPETSLSQPNNNTGRQRAETEIELQSTASNSQESNIDSEASLPQDETSPGVRRSERIRKPVVRFAV
jgi:transposase InsO family protein